MHVLSLFCLLYSLTSSSNAIRTSHKNKIDFTSLTSGVLGNLLGVGSALQGPASPQGTTAAQSAESLKETQGYAAIKAQQSVSEDTRSLEDQLLKFQEELRDIDKATYQERQDLNMKLEARKLELLTAISRLAKLLRATYTMAYPDKKGLPIIIVPKDATDDETIRASAMEEEGLKEAAEGLFTPCAAIAEELQQIVLKRKKTDNEFEQQAESLLSLSLEERMKFDKDKVFYWKQKADEARFSIQQDEEELGIKKPAVAPKLENFATKATGIASGLGTALLQNIIPGAASMNPQAGYPQAGYPQTGYPQTGYPQAGYPQA